jgi:hypothetical protein
MIALPKRKEGHLHLIEELDQLHAESLGVELDGPLGVANSQDHMSHSLDRRHTCPSPFTSRTIFTLHAARSVSAHQIKNTRWWCRTSRT